MLKQLKNYRGFRMKKIIVLFLSLTILVSCPNIENQNDPVDEYEIPLPDSGIGYVDAGNENLQDEVKAGLEKISKLRIT